MATITADPPSLIERTNFIEAGDHVVAAGFVAERSVLVSSDGRVFLDGAPFVVHDGAILVARVSRDRILTGGDDGRVRAIDADGTTRTLAEEKGRWIDALAVGAGGACAWSAGKTVRARDAKGVERSLETASTSRGLAFRPKGYQLAISQNGGALVWLPNAIAPPEKLDWKGSHLDVTWSPDSRFVVTSMQENALHGWRMPEKTHMRMTGYPTKIRSLSWSHDGNWLATSGAEACIVWPFAAKDGPMGKAPRECGVRPARVTAVACHPAALVIAIGYDDGCVMLCRLTDASEIPVRPGLKDGGAESGAVGGRDSVTALAWDASGARLIFGTASGIAGVCALP